MSAELGQRAIKVKLYIDFNQTILMFEIKGTDPVGEIQFGELFTDRQTIKLQLHKQSGAG